MCNPHPNSPGKFLENSSVGVCTVIGFPFGVQTLYSKAFEVKDAIDNGANELDMVLNVGALHSGDDNLVYRDIRVWCWLLVEKL